MTNKERLDANNQQIRYIQTLLNNKKLEAGGDAVSLYTGELEEFDSHKLNLTNTASYRFYKFQNLRKADFSNIPEIAEYVCYQCPNLTELILSGEHTNIGTHAFYQCPINNELHFYQLCSVGTYAFSGTNITSVKGLFNMLDGNAFRTCTQLQEVDIELYGNSGTFAFYGARNLQKCNVIGRSEMKTLGSSAFADMGAERNEPENNVFNFDLTSATFTTVSSNAFSGASANIKNKYFDIKFPQTLTSVGSYAFRYTDHFNLYFLGTTPPTLNANAFNSATNYKILVPASAVDDYKTATNWAAHADYIFAIGSGGGGEGPGAGVYMSEPGTFYSGQTFPRYTADGRIMTWYRDINLTQPADYVTDPEVYYYYTISDDVAFDDLIKVNLFEYDCAVSITDIKGVRYYDGYYAPVVFPLTIETVLIPDGYIPFKKTINGENFDGAVQYEPTSGVDLTVESIYWDGVNPPIIE